LSPWPANNRPALVPDGRYARFGMQLNF